MSKRCEICRGERFIRLPRYRSVTSAHFEANQIESIDASYGTFPCPECAGEYGVDRVSTVTVGATVRVPYKDMEDSKNRPYWQQDIADSIGRELLRAGLIKFYEAPIGEEAGFEVRVYGTIGAVAPTQVATMDQRVSQAALSIAYEVVDSAQAEIRNWGSYYGRHEIAKNDACTFVKQAADRVCMDWREGVPPRVRAVNQ